MLNRWQATKWCSLRKECCHKYVPRSGTTLFDVFDADILCGIRFSAGFAALHQRLSIVKHLRRFHRNIYNHLTASDINRASGYILNNLMLTASAAMPATWGLADASYNPTTVERLQTQQIRYFTEKRIREKTACDTQHPTPRHIRPQK